MIDRNDEAVSNSKRTDCAKKPWRTPRLEEALPVPQTANSKTYAPNDSYVNPNFS